MSLTVTLGGAKALVPIIFPSCRIQGAEVSGHTNVHEMAIARAQEVDVSADARELTGLLEESQDLHSDALSVSNESLEELVEIGHERTNHNVEENLSFADVHQESVRSSLASAGLLGAAGGGALVALLASPAFASSSPDVQMLQTAASIENLAVATYSTALTLPYIGGSQANPVVKKFAQVTRAQHDQHNDAFNAASARLGGKKQTKQDPAFVPVVKKAIAGLSGATAAQGMLGVVALALELETVAAATYVNDMVHLKNANAKKVTASIMGVEAQHAAVLLAVQALLQGGAPQLITLSSTNVASLPAAAGSVGFPHAFYPTNDAAPKGQGAVR